MFSNDKCRDEKCLLENCLDNGMTLEISRTSQLKVNAMRRRSSRFLLL